MVLKYCKYICVRLRNVKSKKANNVQSVGGVIVTHCHCHTSEHAFTYREEVLAKGICVKVWWPAAAGGFEHCTVSVCQFLNCFIYDLLRIKVHVIIALENASIKQNYQ